jgi:hypothetical protein
MMVHSFRRTFSIVGLVYQSSSRPLIGCVCDQMIERHIERHIETLE